MPSLLRRVMLVPLAFAVIAANTLLHGLPLLALAAVKLIVPSPFRAALSRVLVVLAENWIAVNGVLLDVFARSRWEVQGLADLRRDGHYLVISNHQSWVDIPVLQRVFLRKAPFLKFFLKRQLAWVPLLGLVWWALDFPFMRRYSRGDIERNPLLRGKDVEMTRRACERFRQIPVCVMNFVEGTRWTPAKHRLQRSPFQYLLRPKAGGVAFVLQAMAGMLRSILDVTIVYPDGRPTIIDLVIGRVPRIIVNVRERPISPELVGDYENDPVFRERFQLWLNGVWEAKDAMLQQLSGKSSLADAPHPGGIRDLS